MKTTALILSAILCVSCCSDKYGTIGAEFVLADDSRMPYWVHRFNIDGLTGYKIKLIRYEDTVDTNKWKVRGIVYSSKGELIGEVLGVCWWQPESSNQKVNYQIYPKQFVISIDGREEIYEQRGNNKLWIVK